jgi:plastocyanin
MRLLLLVPALAFLPAAAIAATPPIQTIDLFSYGFKPAPITLAAGREVTLKFVNTSTKGHDFTAPEFFKLSRIIAGGVGKDGKVDLHGSETKSVTLVPAAGTYNAHCGRLLHSSFGMHTSIVVR